MENRKETFSAKLKEIASEYNNLLSRLQLIEQADCNQITYEIQRIKQEFQNADSQLKLESLHSRSIEATRMAAAHLQYKKSAEECLQYIEENYKDLNEKAEAMALYAEYTMDFSTQSIKHALLTAMRAIEFQLWSKELTDYKISINTRK